MALTAALTTSRRGPADVSSDAPVRMLCGCEDAPVRAMYACDDAPVRAMSLGGRRVSQPTAELFRAAGLDFDFGPAVVERLVARVESELAKLPE